MTTHSNISWHRVRQFASIVRSPAPVRSAFVGHPLLRVWWKCVLALHGKAAAGCDSEPERWECVANGFRFYGWLYRFVALALIALAGWARVSGLADCYWLGFMTAGAAYLWCAAGLAFAGASDLPCVPGEGIWKLVVFLFFVCLFLASMLTAVSAEAKAVELLPDLTNLAVTGLLLMFGVGSYLIEVVALVTARDGLGKACMPEKEIIRTSKFLSEAQTPPEFLYHGTPERFVESIRGDGLNKGQRHHVHLSPDPETASKVGQRRGRPVVLKIQAAEMHRAGHVFYRSANGVWLVDHVPAQFIGIL